MTRVSKFSSAGEQTIGPGAQQFLMGTVQKISLNIVTWWHYYILFIFLGLIFKSRPISSNRYCYTNMTSLQGFQTWSSEIVKNTQSSVTIRPFPLYFNKICRPLFPIDPPCTSCCVFHASSLCFPGPRDKVGGVVSYLHRVLFLVLDRQRFSSLAIAFIHQPIHP